MPKGETLMQRSRDGCDKFCGGCRFTDVDALVTGLLHVQVATVEHKRVVAGIEAFAHRAGVTIAQPEIRHCRRQVGMISERDRIPQAARLEYGRTGAAQALRDVQRDQRLVLEDEDHVASE